jgi:hypothetical protein
MIDAGASIREQIVCSLLTRSVLVEHVPVGLGVYRVKSPLLIHPIRMYVFDMGTLKSANPKALLDQLTRLSAAVAEAGERVRL